MIYPIAKVEEIQVNLLEMKVIVREWEDYEDAHERAQARGKALIIFCDDKKLAKKIIAAENE